MQFVLLPPPENLINPPYRAYLLDGPSIGGREEDMMKCQVMIVSHVDFEQQSEKIREKIAKFFDTLLDDMLH